jgi:hypothetical protein
MRDLVAVLENSRAGAPRGAGGRGLEMATRTYPDFRAPSIARGEG